MPGDPARLLLVGNDAHTGRVVGDDSAAADDLIAKAVLRGPTVVALRVTPLAAPHAPPLWWVEVREPTASPPATNLVAFAAPGVEPGTLLDPTGLRSAGVPGSVQAGAVRWYPATGEVDQVYVQPAWRRRSIGTALLRAAGVLGRARGWPVLWGDGQRTELGEAWRETARWRSRADDLTVLLAPMTPGEST